MKTVQAIKKLNSISRARLNFRRRPILCTTLYRNLMQASNSSGTFDQLFLWLFYEIFTEDASHHLLYHGAKKPKMTKNWNQGVLPYFRHIYRFKSFQIFSIFSNWKMRVLMCSEAFRFLRLVFFRRSSFFQILKWEMEIVQTTSQPAACADSCLPCVWPGFLHACVRVFVYVSPVHVGLASEAAKMSVISGDPDSPHPSNVTLERVTAQVHNGHQVTITCTISKAQAMGRYWLYWYREE